MFVHPNPHSNNLNTKIYFIFKPFFAMAGLAWPLYFRPLACSVWVSVLFLFDLIDLVERWQNVCMAGEYDIEMMIQHTHQTPYIRTWSAHTHTHAIWCQNYSHNRKYENKYQLVRRTYDIGSNPIAYACNLITVGKKTIFTWSHSIECHAE